MAGRGCGIAVLVLLLVLVVVCMGYCSGVPAGTYAHCHRASTSKIMEVSGSKGGEWIGVVIPDPAPDKGSKWPKGNFNFGRRTSMPVPITRSNPGISEKPIVIDKPVSKPRPDDPGNISLPVENPAGTFVMQSGTVSYIDLEGGFWAITADDGTRYTVDFMPDELKKEGCQVYFMGLAKTDVISYYMWGDASLNVFGIKPANGSWVGSWSWQPGQGEVYTLH